MGNTSQLVVLYRLRHEASHSPLSMAELLVYYKYCSYVCLCLRKYSGLSMCVSHLYLFIHYLSHAVSITACHVFLGDEIYESFCSQLV